MNESTHRPPGRPPLDPEERRDTLMRVKVRRRAAERFDQIATDRGMDRSQAMREAMREYVIKHQRGAGQ